MAAEVIYEDLESGAPGIVGTEGAAAPEPGNEFSEVVAAPVKAKEPKEEKAARKETSELHKRIAELEASERYWADKAKGGAPAPAKADAPDELESLLAGGEIDGDTAASLLDEIGEKGIAALSKRGLVTKDSLRKIVSVLEKRMEAKAEALADGKISGARNQMSAEAKLVKDFPELADESSPMAKTTAKEFAEMVADDPSLKNSYTALRTAAKFARATTGGGNLSERMARIAAQSPARGSRSAGFSEFDDDGQVEITPEAQVFINAGAKYGLTRESYQKNANRRAS